MIKKNLKIMIITSFIILLPILAGIVLWDKLPDRLPMHWNVLGEADEFGSKAFAVFGFPFIMLALHWVAVMAAHTDPKNHNQSGKVMQIVFWVIPVFNNIITAFIFSVAMGKNAPIQLIVSLILGMMFVVIGNYLPKCRQNLTIGIRISWTLKSEENWNRTHRVSGGVWVGCGIVIMLAGLFELIWLTITAFVIIALVPLVYSYILHRKGI